MSSGSTPIIKFVYGEHEYSVPWLGLIKPAEYPVRWRETGRLFGTLNEAIAAAEGAGYDVFVLEVIGDVTETVTPFQA